MNYLLMVDEEGMGLLRALSPKVSFVPVQGMNVKDNNTHAVLITPLPPPVIGEAPKVEEKTVEAVVDTLVTDVTPNAP